MAGNMTDTGRYKLIRALFRQEGYTCYAALDIETPLRESVLLNRYSGAAQIRRMVPLCYALTPNICPGFLRVYTEDSCFTAVFRYAEGEPFAAYFAEHKDMEPEMRQNYTEQLLHTALEYAQLPGEMLLRLLRPEHFAVQEKNHLLLLNGGLPPAPPEGTLCGALSPMVETVLRRPWSATDEQIDWMDALQSGGFESVSALYSAWRALVPVMETDRASKNLAGKFIRFAKRFLRRAWKRFKAARAEKKRLERESA